MQYKKKEEYTFRIPREYKAYLDFKHELQDMGVRFIEEGGSSFQTIVIISTGSFDIKDGKIFFKE